MSEYLQVAAVGYLLGSIPFAYLVSRLWSGADIRRLGSGNVGTTNVMKQIGRIPGVLTALGDGGKGLAAVVAGRLMLAQDQLAPLIALLFAVIGHNWSLWLKFEGGGGLATSIGGLVDISLAAALFTLTLWGLTYVVTGHKYVSSVGACAILPVAMGILKGTWLYVWFGFFLGLMLAVKQVVAWHRFVDEGPQQA
ncbi:MAG: glycerol-3-phosphate acyltransferase [Chloroflexota bacterium]